jgi:tetratricopeptide (TPR) repeat protein
VALAVALGLGGYAAWHLGVDDPSEPRAEAGAAEPERSTPEASEPLVQDEDPAAGAGSPRETTEESASAEGASAEGASAEGASAEGASAEGAPQQGSSTTEPAAEGSSDEGASGEDPSGPAPTGEGTSDEDPSGAGPADEGATEEASPAEAAPGSDVPSLIEQSWAAARERDYPRSETLARQALSMSPQNPRAAYRLAVALYRQQQLDEALTWAERAAEWDPEDPLPISLQGDVHMRRGRFHHAARAYQSALEVEPHFGPAERQLDRLRERGVVQD